MKLLDLILISLGNLWRQKLRATLTISGVVVAIATFVAMLSFGISLQTNIRKQFEELGLFNKVTVSPNNTSESDSTETVKLNDEAIIRFKKLNGIRNVFPMQRLTVTIQNPDSAEGFSARAQAVPENSFADKAFINLAAGNPLRTVNAKEVLLSKYIARNLGYTSPDSAIGKPIILTTQVASIDSAIRSTVRSIGSFSEISSRINPDSIFYREYQEKLFKSEMNSIMQHFVSGYFQKKTTIADTFTITGVLSASGGFGQGRQDILLSTESATPYNVTDPTSDPLQLFETMQKGNFFSQKSIKDDEYSTVTIEFSSPTFEDAIIDSVESFGFSAHSFSSQFKEIRKSFIFMDSILGVLGFIALFVASLGIANTMIMSIIERRQEIGILRAMGGEEKDIRILFLVESGTIGFIGSLFGILLGFVATKIAEIVMKMWVLKDVQIEESFFAFTPELILAAIAFGVLVSVLAGLYPAHRAARTDPIEALRSE